MNFSSGNLEASESSLFIQGAGTEMRFLSHKYKEVNFGALPVLHCSIT